VRCQDPDEGNGKTLSLALGDQSAEDDVVFDCASLENTRSDTLLDVLLACCRVTATRRTRASPRITGVVRVGCFAHVRRGFHEALDTARWPPASCCA